MITLTREEAQQVLDALEKIHAQEGYLWGTLDDVIETLRARLAEKEHEPVAWMNRAEHGTYFNMTQQDGWQPLYTAPQKQDWVGLTDEERSHVLETTHPENRWTIAERIEAKLKEKNG